MTIEELIESLEAIRVELQPRRLSAAQYEAVGWADRHLRDLIDRAREESEAISWREHRAKQFARSVTITASNVGLVNAGTIGTLRRAVGEEP